MAGSPGCNPDFLTELGGSTPSRPTLDLHKSRWNQPAETTAIRLSSTGIQGRVRLRPPDQQLKSKTARSSIGRTPVSQAGEMGSIPIRATLSFKTAGPSRRPTMQTSWDSSRFHTAALFGSIPKSAILIESLVVHFAPRINRIQTQCSGQESWIKRFHCKLWRKF